MRRIRNFIRDKSATKTKLDGETSNDAALSFKHELSREMLNCIDRFVVELNSKFQGLNSIYKTFSVIQNLNFLHAAEKSL